MSNVLINTLSLEDKGMVMVPNNEAFEDFMKELYIQQIGFIRDLEEWYDFFCMTSSYANGFSDDATIDDLIEFVDPEFVPEDFPAIIYYDFSFIIPQTYNDADYYSVPIKAFNIKSIEFKTNDYQAITFD
jgi:hypothetical protein